LLRPTAIIAGFALLTLGCNGKPAPDLQKDLADVEAASNQNDALAALDSLVHKLDALPERSALGSKQTTNELIEIYQAMCDPKITGKIGEGKLVGVRAVIRLYCSDDSEASFQLLLAGLRSSDQAAKQDSYGMLEMNPGIVLRHTEACQYLPAKPASLSDMTWNEIDKRCP
jgi:hypothetical protein